MSDLDLGIDFVFNSPEALAEAKRIKDGVGDIGNTGKSANEKLKDSTEKVKNAQKEQIGIIERLKQKLAEYQENASKATGIRSIKIANQQIQAFEAEIKRLTNVGKDGFDDMGRSIPNFEKPKGQIERMEYLMKLYAQASREALNPELIAKYNAKLEQTAARLKQMNNAGKSGFNEWGVEYRLTGKLEKLQYISKQYEAMSASSNNPEIIAKYNKKLQETQLEIGRVKNIGKDGFDALGNAVAKSTNVIGKAWSSLRQLAYILPGVGVAGLLAFATEPVMKFLISLDLFKAKLTQLRLEQETYGRALASTDYASAVKNVAELKANIDLAKKGLLDKKEVVNQYNETLGSTTGYVKNLIEAEKALQRNGDAYIKITLLKAAAQLALEDAAKEAYKAEQIRENGRQTLSAPNLKGSVKGFENLTFWERLEAAFTQDDGNTKRLLKIATEREAKVADDLTESRKKIFDKMQKQAAELAKKMGFDFFDGKYDDKKGGSDDSLIKQQKALQQRIDDLNKEYARKSQTKDEAETQAVRDKFFKLSKEIQAFNANPKNKYKVDGSGLDKTRDLAIADLVYRQNTERLKISYAEEKKIYEEYENFKVAFGKKKADERFKGQLDTDKTYMQRLEAVRGELLNTDPTKMNGAQKEYLAFLDKAINEEILAEKRKYDELLKGLLNYEQTRRAMVEAYEANRAKLVQNGNTGAVIVLDRIHKEALNKLDDENTQKLTAFKALFNGIDRLSDKASKKVIADANAMLQALQASGKISPELAKQIKEKLTDTSVALESRLPARLKTLGSELQNIAGLVGSIDGGFGKTLTTLGGVIGNVGQLKQQITDFKAIKKDDVLGQISGGLGMFSTFMSIGKALGDIFSSAGRAQAEQAKYANDLQAKKDEAVIKALDRQLALINKVYGTEKLTKYEEALRAIGEAAVANSSKIIGMYKLTGVQKIDDILKKFNDGTLEKSGFERSMFNGLVDKGQISQVATADLATLQKLLDEGKLDENTARLAQSLIDLKEKANEAANAIKETLTGTSFESLSDGIISAITDGATDGAKNFEDIMRKAMINALKSKSLTAQIQNFYDDFTEASKAGLDQTKIAALKAQYDKIIADGLADAQKLQQITGVSFNPTNESNSYSGAVKGITADQANILAGATNGQRLAQLETNVILKQSGADQLAALKANYEVQKQIEQNTKRTADTSDTFLPYLKDIATNTKDTTALALRAAAKYFY